jgi:hypothetical protein
MEMATHAFTVHVERPARMQRVHVLIRLLLLVAIGGLGISSLYWVVYLALPALAALGIADRGGERYLADTAPWATRVLAFLVGLYAYLWFLTDRFPPRREDDPRVTLTPGAPPTTRSALLRLLTSIPAVIVLVVLSMVAGLLWVIAALAVLIAERVPAFIADFLATTLRYQFRLVAYHLSLVDEYPTLAVDEPLPTAHGVKAV